MTYDTDKMRQYMRQRRAYRRQNGLCVDCGSASVDTNRKYCQKCLNKGRAKNA